VYYLNLCLNPLDGSLTSEPDLSVSRTRLEQLYDAYHLSCYQTNLVI